MARPRGLPKTGGRQKGVANKRTREIAEAAMAQGLTPLEYMLAVLRDETVEPERRDEMAKAAAPYLHPRLAAIEAKLSVAVDHETALDQLEASPLGAATGAKGKSRGLIRSRACDPLASARRPGALRRSLPEDPHQGGQYRAA